MPYISTKTSAVVSADKEKTLKEKLGRAIENISGKTEAWLMLSIEGGVPMYFKGDNSTPCAMVEVQIFGKASDADYDKMTAAVCRIFTEVLGIPGDRVYVKYEECFHWGWNGTNF